MWRPNFLQKKNLCENECEDLNLFLCEPGLAGKNKVLWGFCENEYEVLNVFFGEN